MKPADLLRRIPGVTPDLSAALDGKAKWYLWSGKIGRNAGKYWIPNLFDASKLPAAVTALAKSEGISEFSAAGLVEKSHKGIGNSEIGLVPWAFAEMDAVKRDEQDRRLDALTSATGLEWAMRVFSGGKSVHAYIAFTTPLLPDDPLRLEIQKLLIAILEGDTRITDLNRLMRLPGYAGQDRPQPVLSISAARYDATDIRDRLLSYAASLGITDVATAFRALQVAEDLEHEAARGHDDALVAARTLRDARATVTMDGITSVTRAWKKTGGSGTAGAGGSIGSGSITYVAPAAWINLTAGLAIGDRCSPPCCVGYIRGTTGKYYGDSIRCHRCQVTYRPERAVGELPPEVEDVTDFMPASMEIERKPMIIDDPDLVEAEAMLLLQEGHFEAVLDLAEQVSTPSDDLYVIVEEALAGLRRRAREEEDERGRFAREAKAEKVREAKTKALADGLQTYADRVAKKKAEAAKVPERVRLGAEAALALAGEIVEQVANRRAALGLPVERPQGAKPCGVSLALHHGYDGTAAGVRICRDENCPVHGPVHQARRISAVVGMPLLGKGEDGLPDLGTPLGARTLHEYRFAANKVKNFRGAWSGTEFPTNSASPTNDHKDGRNLSETLHVHGYVAFDVGNGTITALTTHPLKIGTGQKGGRPSALAGSYVGEVASSDAKARIVALGLESVRATKGEDLDGMTLDPVVITGVITSSQTLHLDPEGTVRKALGAPWLAIGEVGLTELRAGLKAAGKAVSSHEDIHSPGEIGKVTAKDVLPDTLFKIVAAAGTSFGKPPRISVTFHEDLDASNLFDGDGIIEQATA